MKPDYYFVWMDSDERPAYPDCVYWTGRVWLTQHGMRGIFDYYKHKTPLGIGTFDNFIQQRLSGSGKKPLHKSASQTSDKRKRCRK